MALTETERRRLLEPPAGKIRMVLDTDTYNEIDDQFAIVQMLLSPDRLNVEGIYAAPFLNSRSTSPGHGMELSYDEILRLLERLGVRPDGLVHKGVTEYVGFAKKPQAAAAVDHLIARARAGSPENPLYVVCIAAISNVASAILKAPDILDRIVVVWLGGHALDWPDTVEFNLKQDVGGAQVVFDSGVAMVQIPCMGVTTNLDSTVPEIERHVEPCGAIGAFLAQRFKEYSDNHLGWSKEIWDMAAIAWLLNADWTPSVIVPAPILTDNITWSVDRSRHSMRYVTYIDRTPVFRDFFSKLRAFKQ